MPFSRSISPQSTRRPQRLFAFFFSAFSHRGVGHRPYGPEAANSAVNYYVSGSIRVAVFWSAAGLTPETRHLKPLPQICRSFPTSASLAASQSSPIGRRRIPLPHSDFRFQLIHTSDFRVPTSDFRLPASDFCLPSSALYQITKRFFPGRF
jgi:hypothetical protein